MVQTTDSRECDSLFVLFGAGGDLAKRLVVPALYNLYLDHHLPEHFRLIGADLGDFDDASLAQHFRDSVAAFSRRGAPKDEDWQGFSDAIRYHKGDATKDECYQELCEVLDAQEKELGVPAQYVFYMATPPSLFEPIAKGLAKAGLARDRDRDRSRIVVEKPLGRDLESFREINRALCEGFDESQIYRIDHFLGKETVQNILALRFANAIYEPVWNRRYIDHVAITVAEDIGVEQRGPYYEHAGALRDMVQNHLLQLLCLVAMEPPVAYDAEDIRGRKMDVLHAMRPIPPDDIARYAARGQYDSGWISGKEAPAYRDEANVAPDSNTETFAALKLYVDNWRWQGVPFYLRTGKRLSAKVSEISIRFKDVPHKSFPASVGLNSQPTRLVIQIQPEEGVVLKFMAKEPGSELRLRQVDMRFCYSDTFKAPSPHAYETLIWDVLIGDATLFMRADQVEAAWKLLMPVIEAWENNPAPDFPNYAAGSWGPEAAEALVARDGISWLTPTLRNTAKK